MNGLRALSALLDAHGEALPLAEAAIAVAVDEDPGCRPDAVREDLDTLARATGFSPGEGSPGRVMARLNEVLFSRLGFTGDVEDYHGVDNSLIHRVLGRRRGMPLTLSIVYAEVAGRLGVALDGVAFPSHFVLRPRHARAPVFIDPFHRGRLLDEDQLWGFFQQLHPGAQISEATWTTLIAPAPNRDVIARLVRNLKRSHVDRGDAAGVLRACERLLLLAPTPEEHRDRGLVLADLGRTEEARDALATYLAHRPDADDARVVALRLSMLR